ncbi:hypothetical protein RYX36_013976, partial [Vicia faba]
MKIININETLFELYQQTSTENVSYNPQYTACVTTPPNILSDGIWGDHKIGRNPLKSSFPIGLILGPMVPVLEEYKRMVFPYGSQDTLATITTLGYVFFLFETGIKMDFNMIVNTGRKGWVIFFFELIAPMVIGFVTRHLTIRNNFENSSLEGDIVMVGHNTTSFAVIVSLLNDLKLLNSELGRLALSVALVGDIFSNVFVTISSTMVNTNHYIPVTMRLGYLHFVYLPSCHVLDCPIFLPFIFGLATPAGPLMGSTLIKRVHLLGIKLFLPIFMTTSTMKMEYGFWNLNSSSTLDITMFVFFSGYFVKMVAFYLPSVFFKMPLKDGISLSLLLNCKGVVEVTMYSTALDRN